MIREKPSWTYMVSNVGYCRVDEVQANDERPGHSENLAMDFHCSWCPRCAPILKSWVQYRE